MLSHACPATLTVDTRTRASTAAGKVFAGGTPGFGGDCSVPSADGYGASEIARPHAAKREGCCGAHRWIAATMVDPRAMRAGQPFAVAYDGITIQSKASTPSVPIAAPAARSSRGKG